MKIQKIKKWAALSLITLTILSCEDEVRNIALSPDPDAPTDPLSGEVNPQDINVDGFDFLERMQGDWIGINRVIADDWDWFAFDYRPISSSHIHGLFEGGSAGNLMTSFFVTDFKGTRTIMARNGGLLNGIYRTSYFVLDSIRTAGTSKYFRLVDAVGGASVMYMELRFVQDSLYFNAYTSRLGLNTIPTRHMTFRATKQYTALARNAAVTLGFPENIPAWDFSAGFNNNFLYRNPGDILPKSASFLAADANKDVYQLATESGDPFTILDHPYVSTLTVDISRNPAIEGLPWFLYLSQLPLTEPSGHLTQASEPYNTVLKFSEIIGIQDTFTFTYLHPGNYFINVIADSNQDGTISAGDISAASVAVSIAPQRDHQITINNINIQN